MQTGCAVAHDEGDNAWYDDLSAGARVVLCAENRIVAAPDMDNR